MKNLELKSENFNENSESNSEFSFFDKYFPFKKKEITFVRHEI